MSRAVDPKRRGFTLIELLVALAIFAVISVMSLRAVSAAIESRARIEEEGRKWRELGRLFVALESDLANLLVGSAAPLAGAHVPASDNGAWLAFARSGSGNDDDTVIAPRAVVYRLAGAHIERATYHDLQAPAASAPFAETRYPSIVRSLSLRYLTERGDWEHEWNRSDGAIPRALELALELGSGERLRRVVLVR